ncbi:MAG: trigger factor [Candidatus Omnitrophota bacterium]|jgi:trigger factor
MKSKLKKLKGTARELDIMLLSGEVNKALDDILKEIGKTAEIPGFRPGKAPLDIVRKKYEKDAADEVKKRLIPEAYQQALNENKLNPVSYPEISDISIDTDGSLRFKAKVDVYPDIKLRKYKGLQITKQKITLKDEEIEEAILRIRNMHAEYPEKDSHIEQGDFGICDIEAFIDGEAITKKHNNMWIEADKDSSMLGLGEKLCGMKKGDSKEINATLPENYPDKKYAGKAATFNVEIKDVRSKKLPELNEEFAKKLEKGSVGEMKEELRAQLLAKKEHNEKVKMKNQIMEELLKKNVFDVPESMVKRQLDVLLERARNELAQKGVDQKTIESEKDKLKENLKKDAENKVRLYFILDSIANAEKITVEDEEVENWIKALADSYKQPFENVKKYYEEKNLLPGLKEQLREDKTLDFLLSEASIAEKGK